MVVVQLGWGGGDERYNSGRRCGMTEVVCLEASKMLVR